MSSIFSRIISGEITAYQIGQNDHAIAIMDRAPLMPGHILVISKREVDHFFSLEQNELMQLMVLSQQIAAILPQVFPCKRVGMAVIGFEVPHAHMHLYPLQREEQLHPKGPSEPTSTTLLAQQAAQLRALLS